MRAFRQLWIRLDKATRPLQRIGHKSVLGVRRAGMKRTRNKMQSKWSRPCQMQAMGFSNV